MEKREQKGGEPGVSKIILSSQKIVPSTMGGLKSNLCIIICCKKPSPCHYHRIAAPVRIIHCTTLLPPSCSSASFSAVFPFLLAVILFYFPKNK